MECDVCSRPHSNDLGFYCVTCARSALYHPRLEATRVLLAKEQLADTVNNVVGQRSRVPAGEALQNEQDLALVWSSQAGQIQRRHAEERTQETLGHIQKMREELAQMRNDLGQKRKDLEARRISLATINASLPARRARYATAISERVRRGSQSSDAIHNKSTETREFLCKEAAQLLRLKHRKKLRSGVMKDVYSIIGLPIVDLREVNNVRCTELTAALDGVAHLVALTAFYLSIRLPAEITLPGREYPQPTIFTPVNSYTGRKVPSPGNTPSHTGNGNPSLSRYGSASTLPRPRPLFLNADDKDERIAQTARRDPNAFSLFVEGISLLAWDIAWLCRSQGFVAGSETWEDVCNIGGNLWQLLLAQSDATPVAHHGPPGRDRPTRPRPTRKSSTTTEIAARVMPEAKLGQRTHSSACSFLGDGQSVVRGWKVSKHTVVADALKKALVAEMSNAEWEILEEQEWDDGGENFAEAVLIRTRPMDGTEYDDARSVMTARPSLEEPVISEAAGEAEGGRNNTKAWTKVKRRDQ